MKHSRYILLLSTVVLLTACGGGKTEQSASKAPAAGQTGAQTSCYSLREGKDLTAIQLKQDGNAISGYYAWEPYEKDGAHGTLNGSLNNGVIKADHTYMIEGSIQTEEVYFKLDGNTLFQGSGELTEDAKGKLVVKDPASLQFTEGFAKTDCADIKDAIANAEQISAMIKEQQ